MRVTRAFLLGAAAAAVLAYVFAAALATVVAATGGTITIALGPLVGVAVERDGTTTATTFGAGILLVALVGGLVNGLAASVISRRRRGDGIA